MEYLRFFSFITLVFSAHVTFAATAEDESTVCTQSDVLQQCIDSAETNIISLSPGIHETSGIFISSNQTFIVPENSILKLADDAILNGEAFGGDANFVIASIGKPDQLVSNVHIIINGEVDGNKDVHVYEKGGVEGIDWKWVENSTISGSGVVHSANGDGIDLDAVHNIQISDVTVRDNGDSGIHFGSPRPIMPSSSNVVIGVTSINNGFRIGKSGFDLSWPNPDGVAYINCTAVDNYRNFKIEASGGVIYNSKSIDSGTITKSDDLSGADYAIINGKNVTNKKLISAKTKILLKRDVKKILQMDYHEYLDGIDY